MADLLAKVLAHPATPAYLMVNKLAVTPATMTPALELRWTFEPPELFESLFEVESADHELSFERGVVIAKIDQDALLADPAIRRRVEAFVENMLLGVQIHGHTLYTLSEPSVTRLQADGSRVTVIECKPGRVVYRGHRPDLRYTRDDGTVVDTREERIRRKQYFARGAAELAPSDEVLSRMLRSYGAAVRDPSDELIHLYEIRDSLASRFGGEASARQHLKVPRRAWARFGQLCNDLPLKEGRHRGSTLGTPRPATPEELDEARSLAATLIESYMSYIRATASK